MFEIILYVIAFMVSFPILITIGLYYAFKFIYQNKIKAFHQSVNWTTLLYILAVHTVLADLFNHSFILYIVVLLLLILTIVVIVQWKKYIDVDLYKAIKFLWRISFLIFFLLYIALVFYGIVSEILN
ncbi:DUF3397 domain-containing protein [Ornithinibacillus halotolerans]|uniref:DUF3397 domain-containing protein n=1 Tax=Ornithinibacillus halotolerans TaxID=1274357 RepID=A0A916WBP4_9BACI|nr:DUF3397 domain-containing protein [Ornithinibacillus halotolerans]GGA83838.1 hypothetical protein GCM10008025_28700 [Ornithinibacillus halotolerans]